jgi:hypothetical protein
MVVSFVWSTLRVKRSESESELSTILLLYERHVAESRTNQMTKLLQWLTHFFSIELVHNRTDYNAWVESGSCNLPLLTN